MEARIGLFFPNSGICSAHSPLHIMRVAMNISLATAVNVHAPS